MAEHDWGRPQAPPRGGGGRWLLLLIAIIALTMFFKTRPQQGDPAQRQELPRGTIESPQAQRPAAAPGQVDDDGDWSLEQLPGRRGEPIPTTTTARPIDSPSTAAPKKTTEGDWELEEVAPDGQAPRGGESRKAEASQTAADPKKSTEGDWSVEELKSKPSPALEK